MGEALAAGATPGRRVWVGLCVCLALGLAARLGAVALPHVMGTVTVSGRPLAWWADRPFFPDSLEYIVVARNIRSGDGLMVDAASRIGRMPGYPVFLALVQTLFGESILAARVADALVGTGVVALAWLLARELFGRREALAAGLIVAVYPFLVIQTLLLLSEVLFIACMLAGGLCLALAWKRGGRKWAALAGLAFGLATLVRGSFLHVAVLTAVLWALGRKLDRAALKGAAVMLGMFALTMAPWVARNWRASGGHLVVTTLRMGPSLYEGLNPCADGGPMMNRINWDSGTQGLSEYERDRHWREKAIEYAENHPRRVLALAGIKLARFWNVVPNMAEFNGGALCLVLGAPYALVMALALVGLARSWRRGDVALILLLPVVYYSIVHMVFVGSVRYREAVMPLLMVVAAHGAATLWDWVTRGRSAAHGDRAGVQRGEDGGPAPGAGAGGAGDEAGGGGG